MVQGVGFRHWTLSAAGDLSLNGYVKNLPDGSVEALLQGTEGNVTRMLELLRQGPRFARVDQVRRLPLPAGIGKLSGFSITG